MRIKPTQQGGFMTEMSRDEVLLLSNVLNEVCNGFGIPDFEGSIGVTRERAFKLSTKIEVLATDTERHANHLGQNVLGFDSQDLSILKNALKSQFGRTGTGRVFNSNWVRF